MRSRRAGGSGLQLPSRAASFKAQRTLAHDDFAAAVAALAGGDVRGSRRDEVRP